MNCGRFFKFTATVPCSSWNEFLFFLSLIRTVFHFAVLKDPEKLLNHAPCLMQVRVEHLHTKMYLDFLYQNRGPPYILVAFNLIYYLWSILGWKPFPLHYHRHCHKFIGFIYNFRRSFFLFLCRTTENEKPMQQVFFLSKLHFSNVCRFRKTQCNKWFKSIRKCNSWVKTVNLEQYEDTIE